MKITIANLSKSDQICVTNWFFSKGRAHNQPVDTIPPGHKQIIYVHSRYARDSILKILVFYRAILGTTMRDPPFWLIESVRRSTWKTYRGSQWGFCGFYKCEGKYLEK